MNFLGFLQSLLGGIGTGTFYIDCINSTLFPYRILDTKYFYETIYEAGNMERTI